MKTRGVMLKKDSAAKSLLTGFFKKMGVEIIEVFYCRETHFSENRGFCSRIKMLRPDPNCVSHVKP